MIDAKRVLGSEVAPPACLAAALSQMYDKGWLLWEPMVLWEEIKADLGLDLPRPTKDTIMALRLCTLLNTPWQDWHPFLVVCSALNRQRVVTDTAFPVSPSHLNYAVDIMRTLKPDEPFEDEVKKMAAILLWDGGICWVPDYPLGSLVNEYLSSLQKSPEQQRLLSFFAKDYLADDGLDSMTDFDPVRMHTIKLRALDLHRKMMKKMEAEMVS